MQLRGKQLFLLLCSGMFLQFAASAAEVEFDVSEFKPSPFEFRGYAQIQTEALSVNQSAALYQLQHDTDENLEQIIQTTGSLELEVSYKKGMSRYLLRSYSSKLWNEDGNEDDEHDLYEGYVNLHPNPGFSLDIGKKLNRWGKGYAWNPVGFVERKKDPSDPELSREGYWMQSMDFIHSMEGRLQTIAFTPVVLPNNGHINDDFGTPDHNNIAARVYLLYRDTDIDFMFLNNGSKTARYGFDFAYNIASHFEIHGEYAYITDAARQPVNADCMSNSRIIEDVASYLVGIRYRTDDDINHIVEYYYNGEGYTEEELRQYYLCVQQAWDAQDTSLLDQLAPGGSLNNGSFTTQNPMRQYLHIKSWWNEPYDILYFVPGIQLFYNIEDGSYSIAPEILYTSINNLQLRMRVKFFSDEELTEFGEKLNENKLEIRLRYYF